MAIDPKVSIIMGIYNCQDTIDESINSIINQSYTSWELIMCDDGSTDNTYNLARYYEEKYPEKIKLLSNDKNMGLSYTLNKCLKHSRGIYICRQDGDDISTFDRLHKLVSFLDNNKEYSFVSSALLLFDENGEWGKITPIQKPVNSDFIKGTPFAHAACMIRREDIEKIGGYRDIMKTLRVEDYDLWFRLYEMNKIGYNLLEPLYKVRDDRHAIQRRKYKYRINEAYVMLEGFKRLNIPLYKRIYFLKPLLVGLVPRSLYKYIRKRKYIVSKT